VSPVPLCSRLDIHLHFVDTCVRGALSGLLAFHCIVTLNVVSGPLSVTEGGSGACDSAAAATAAVFSRASAPRLLTVIT